MLKTQSRARKIGIVSNGRLYTLKQSAEGYFVIHSEIDLKRLSEHEVLMVTSSLDHVMDGEDSDWEQIVEMLREASQVSPFRREEGKLISDRILITGGIGDFIALESHMPDVMRRQMVRVYIASRAYGPIAEMAARLWGCEVVPIDADYSARTFYTKEEVTKHLGGSTPRDWDDVADWSIMTKFPEIMDGRYSFVGTDLFQAMVHSEYRPAWKEYVVICPSTDTETGTGRGFGTDDWESVRRYLRDTRSTGVVIAGHRIKVPRYNRLINLSGKTTLAESISMLKHADEYIGIDSFMSILAAQVLPPERLAVKSINKHFYDNASIYCAPWMTPTYVTESIDISW